MPTDFGLSLETLQSGDIDKDELNAIVGEHVLDYLQLTLIEYEAVSVELEISTLSEQVRRLEEAQPMILQVRAAGFVYFKGDNIPSTNYLNEVVESAFEGDLSEQVLGILETADDPVLRSTTSVWSGLADSKQEYLAVESSSTSIGDIFLDNIYAVSAGLACGVLLIALFAGFQYRRWRKEVSNHSYDALENQYNLTV